jgi:hypothetical protein
MTRPVVDVRLCASTNQYRRRQYCAFDIPSAPLENTLGETRKQVRASQCQCSTYLDPGTESGTPNFIVDDLQRRLMVTCLSVFELG